MFFCVQLVSVTIMKNRSRSSSMKFTKRFPKRIEFWVDCCAIESRDHFVEISLDVGISTAWNVSGDLLPLLSRWDECCGRTFKPEDYEALDFFCK